MLHVTCDLCGKELRPGEDEHFFVKIEELKKLISDSDAEAIQLASSMASNLNGTSVSPDVQRMISRLKEYDFEEAMTLLAVIASSARRSGGHCPASTR